MLPERALVSAITMAELVQGPLLATSEQVRRARARLVTLDLLIAATAHAHGLALYTRNPDDVGHLGDLVEVVAV